MQVPLVQKLEKNRLCIITEIRKRTAKSKALVKIQKKSMYVALCSWKQIVSRKYNEYDNKTKING